MANYRETIIKDQYAFDDESNPSTSYYDIIRPRTTLDAVFDDADAGEKTLRVILDEIKFSISHGTGIVFPVTSVNGQSLQNTGSSDVVITADSIPGFDERIKKYLDTADFTENQIEEINNIVNNIISGGGTGGGTVKFVNGIGPDASGNVIITADSLDVTNELTNKIEQVTDEIIAEHNRNSSAHSSLFNSINRRIDNLTTDVGSFDDSISALQTQLQSHNTDPSAHSNIMSIKENIANKIMSATSGGTGIVESGMRDTTYPTVGSVIDYVAKMIADSGAEEDRKYDIHVIIINKESDLPDPTTNLINYIYMVNDMDVTKPGEQYNGIVSYIRAGDGISVIRFPVSRTQLGEGLTTDNTGAITIDTNSPIFDDIGGGGGLNPNNTVLMDGTENGTVKLSKQIGSGTPVVDTAHVFGLKALAYVQEAETQHIKNAAVTTEKIATNGVETTNIAQFAVTTEKIYPGAVINERLAKVSPNTVKANIKNSSDYPQDTVIRNLMNPLFSFPKQGGPSTTIKTPAYPQSYITYVSDGTEIGLKNHKYLIVYFKDPDGGPYAAQIAFDLTDNSASVRSSENGTSFSEWGDFGGGGGGSGGGDDPSLPEMDESTYARVILTDDTYLDLKTTGDLSNIYLDGDDSTQVTMSVGSYKKSQVKKFDFGPAFTNTSLLANFLLNYTSLKQINCIPKTVRSIGNNFLKGCTSFSTQLTLPPQVYSVGTGFMNECQSFTGPLGMMDYTTNYIKEDTTALSTTNQNAKLYTVGVNIIIDN